MVINLLFDLIRSIVSVCVLYYIIGLTSYQLKFFGPLFLDKLLSIWVLWSCMFLKNKWWYILELLYRNSSCLPLKFSIETKTSVGFPVIRYLKIIKLHKIHHCHLYIRYVLPKFGVSNMCLVSLLCLFHDQSSYENQMAAETTSLHWETWTLSSCFLNYSSFQFVFTSFTKWPDFLVWPMLSLQVVKTVYASPSRVDFQLDSKKVSLFTFKKHALSFTDAGSIMYLGSGDNTCLSRYLFCSWWLRLHFWCCGKCLWYYIC